MDNHHLRAIILKLQDRLSDTDRKRLHFFLANDVPRGIRDDSSLAGTLNLMESLFDQDKINEQDFTFLINAFKEIRCSDAVKLLGEHKKRLQIRWLNQPNLTSVIPSLNEEIVQDQEEDKSASQTLLNSKTNYGNNNKVYDSNNTNINPVTINVDNKKIVSSIGEENQPFYIALRMNKYLFCIILFVIMILGILLSIFITKIYKVSKLERRMKNEISFGEQNRENQRLESINNLTSENQQLKNQLKQFQMEKDNCLIKPGKIFGSSDGFYFDDSSLRNFTYSHYLSGLTIRVDPNAADFESYQFHYYSPINNQTLPPSQSHGNQAFRTKMQINFMETEKIKRVEGRFLKKTINQNGLTKVYITGLQFMSTNNITRGRYRGTVGEVFREEYDGYILGFATGKSREYVEQLQFFWYRLKTN